MTTRPGGSGETRAWGGGGTIYNFPSVLVNVRPREVMMGEGNGVASVTLFTFTLKLGPHADTACVKLGPHADTACVKPCPHAHTACVKPPPPC